MSPLHQRRQRAGYSLLGRSDLWGGGSLNLFNCMFIDCVVDNNTIGDAYDRYHNQEYYGGAIYLNSNAHLSCENTDFINCKAIALCQTSDPDDRAYTKGGAICQYEGSATFTSCEFVGCTAESMADNGGHRSAEGGALRYESCAPQLYDCYIDDCSAKSEDEEGNSAEEGHGGAVYLRITLRPLSISP